MAGATASRSFTALGKGAERVTSLISIVHERTMVAFSCNTRGCERVVYPMIIIIVVFASIVLLAVATGTQAWVEVDVDQNLNGSVENRGWVQFGLFRGDHNVRTLTTESEMSYSIFSQFSERSYQNVSSIPLGRIYATISFNIVAMLLGVVAIAFTTLNTYQTVTTWWKGPTMMYTFCLVASLSGLSATGLFLDFYLWDLDTSAVLVHSTGFAHLLTSHFVTSKVVYWSFGLQLAGSLLPLLGTLLCWRLAVLVPQKEARDNMGASQSMFAMSNVGYDGGDSSLFDQQANERGGVLY